MRKKKRVPLSIPHIVLLLDQLPNRLIRSQLVSEVIPSALIGPPDLSDHLIGLPLLHRFSINPPSRLFLIFIDPLLCTCICSSISLTLIIFCTPSDRFYIFSARNSHIFASTTCMRSGSPLR